MTAALVTDGLGKRYGRVWALRDCSLTLPAGRIIALVGPNGAGKSTLLHLAIGLLRPTQGTVRLFDEPVAIARPAGLARVGFVAQDHPLYRGFTIADLLRLGRELNPRWDQAYAEQRLDTLAIASHRRAGTLSGGQQAQVALTMALAKRPRLLVLDEPVAGLDPIARRDFMKTLVDAVAAGGLTVLLSSHVVAELERICDHLILLREGRARLAGDIDDLLDQHRILTGPRGPATDPAWADGVIAATHSDRHSDLLVRLQPGAATHPRWESHAVGLEELVLAYLEHPDTVGTPAPAPKEA